LRGAAFLLVGLVSPSSSRTREQGIRKTAESDVQTWRKKKWDEGIRKGRGGFLLAPGLP